MLGQKDNYITHVIYFTPVEYNYTVIEKKFLVVVCSINKFRHYITGYEVFIHTDHYAIRFLMNNPITNGRMTRWLLLLQQFNITIVNQSRKENLVAYFLSRINHGGK